MPSTRKIGTSLSRALRRRATDPEKALWRALKRIPVYGSHFRRQVPIAPYVADFACLKARLIIELDGGILLIKRAIEPGYGKWTFPGGFVERGEVAEVAAEREALEETGLTIETTGIVGLYTYEGPWTRRWP